MIEHCTKWSLICTVTYFISLIASAQNARPTKKYSPCILKMPAVLQMALLKIFRCAVGVHFCIWLYSPDSGVLKIAFLKTSSGVWWCAITLTCLKRQNLKYTIELIFSNSSKFFIFKLGFVSWSVWYNAMYQTIFSLPYGRTWLFFGGGGVNHPVTLLPFTPWTWHILCPFFHVQDEEIASLENTLHEWRHILLHADRWLRWKDDSYPAILVTVVTVVYGYIKF